MANVTHIHKCRRKHDKQVHLNGFVIKRLYVVVAAAGFGCYFWFGTALFLFFFFFFFDSAICILFANSDLTVCVTLYMNSMDVDRCTSTSSVSLHKSFIAIWHKWHNNSNGKCVFFFFMSYSITISIQVIFFHISNLFMASFHYISTKKITFRTFLWFSSNRIANRCASKRAIFLHLKFCSVYSFQILSLSL